ncbi:MAG: outer membrane protein assembly factor BamD [Immundisolibacterales bacterium]|nr:outer membrane protein assembly factor BamD [Immundisolibacterales bacterium]
MKMHAGWSVAFALVVAFLLAACTGGGDSADPTRNWSEARLYREARAALDDGDFETAIDYYGKLGARFPFGSHAPQGQLDLVYAYYRFREPDSAIEEAERFIEFHPRHPEAAYAHYIKGLTNYGRRYGWFDRFLRTDRAERDTSEFAAAFEDFKAVAERFPDSRYAADATDRMVELRDPLARHELVVAQYYLERETWVAAANRAQYVVRNFPTSPSSGPALAIMVQAYRAIGLDGLAADSLRVLRANHPGAPDPSRTP